MEFWVLIVGIVVITIVLAIIDRLINNDKKLDSYRSHPDHSGRPRPKPEPLKPLSLEELVKENSELKEQLEKEKALSSEQKKYIDKYNGVWLYADEEIKRKEVIIKNQAHRLDKVIKANSKCVEAYKRIKEEYEGKINEKNVEITQLTELLESADTERLDELEKNLKIKNAQINKKDNDLLQKNNEIQDLKNKLFQFNNQLNNKIEELKSQLSDKDNNINQLNNRIQELKSQLSDKDDPEPPAELICKVCNLPFDDVKKLIAHCYGKNDTEHKELVKTLKQN